MVTNTEEATKSSTDKISCANMSDDCGICHLITPFQQICLLDFFFFPETGLEFQSSLVTCCDNKLNITQK